MHYLVDLPRSLDYPGIGPEHSFLKDVGRAEYFSVTDQVACASQMLFCTQSTRADIDALSLFRQGSHCLFTLSIHTVCPQEALDAFQRLSQLEGIIPALETSHAIAHLERLAPTLKDGTRVVINCSGRGDKDGEGTAGLEFRY